MSGLLSNINTLNITATVGFTNPETFPTHDSSF
jgi:hypothetical protein